MIALASVLALAVAIYDYVTPATGIDGSDGVMLVGAAAGLMLAAALAWALFDVRGWLRSLLVILILLDILGSALCGYFLESTGIMAAMALALLGWLLQAVITRKGA